MANKRDLKKQVRYICGDLASECMLAADYVKGVDRTTMQKIVSEIARLQTATLANMSFAFDKVPSDFDNGATYTRNARPTTARLSTHSVPSSTAGCRRL